jgi:SOS response regulatory protein OraA/RecX
MKAHPKAQPMETKRLDESLEEQLEEQRYALRRKTERLINVRDRSEAELRGRLRNAGFDEGLIDGELSRLLLAGLVDDERFTRLYIAGKKRSGWGRIRIERELGRFGIDLREREGYPERFFCEDDECERASACLARFCLRSRAKDPQAAQYRFLLSRGFSMETTRKAIFNGIQVSGHTPTRHSGECRNPNSSHWTVGQSPQ